MDKTTKYTGVGALTGLAGALLLRKLISSKSSPMGWGDALIWGGTGAALGGLIGRGAATVDTNKPNEDQKTELKEQLTEVDNKIAEVKKDADKKSGLGLLIRPGLWTIGGGAAGFTIGDLKQSTAEALHKFREKYVSAYQKALLKGKPKKAAKIKQLLDNSWDAARNADALGIGGRLLPRWMVPKHDSILLGRKAGTGIGALLGLGIGYGINYNNIADWINDPNSKWFRQSPDAQLVELNKQRNSILKELNKGN